ncbi:serine/threonine-protein kinase PknK [Plesiocystis pacifica]|uniref:serine/threonine-protein kinase n=1 Tax=Plesiocystis pacifica TaxID=191768 RepID=UPI0018DC11EA|nr:serine/threonine-protein kinase [Plesiocystis pacifica]
MVHTSLVQDGRILRERYVLERELGQGGAGVVYHAFDLVDEREVAIRVIGDHPGRDLLEVGLRYEAKQVRGLEHPGLVPIFEFNRDGDLLFLVMPLLEGRTLRDLLLPGPLPIPLAAEIGRQVAEVLAHAHGEGVIHRDLKPENLNLSMVDGALHVRVMDFGLSPIADVQAAGEGSQAALSMGTPEYLAPEQVWGGDTDPRTDLYALGLLLYECIVGRPPFVGTGQAVLQAITEATPVRPAVLRTDLPRALDLLVVELLAKDPSRRPGDAGDVAKRLSLYADGSTAATLLIEPARSRGAWTLGGEADARTMLGKAIGRDRELRALDARLTTARSSRLQLVLLSGAIGMGKTTLLDELVLACQQRSIELLRTRADEDHGRLGPFEEVLTAGMARRPEAAGDLVEIAADLVEVFPALNREGLGELASRREPDPQLFAGLSAAAPRRRPRRGVRTEVTRELSPRERVDMLIVRAVEALVADGRPLALTIDDAHLCGETVELVELLFRRLPHSPLLIVVAYQDDGLPPNHALRRLERCLRAHPRCLRQRLGPIAPERYDRLLAQFLGSEQPELDLAESLHHQSGGRPLFARELVRAALESGLLIRREGSWYLDAALWPVPRSLRVQLAGTLNELEDGLVTALRTGSVLAVGSGGFELGHLAELHTRPRNLLVRQLEHAVNRGMLTEHREGGAVVYRFSSEVLRRVIHDDIHEAARRKLHRFCAARLRKIIRGEEDVARDDALFAHLLEAGELADARTWAVALAQRAAAEHRPLRALSKLSALLEVADSLPAVERAELYLASAELELMRKEHGGALSALQRLAATLDESDDSRLEQLGTRGAGLARTMGKRQLADRLLGLRPQDGHSAELELAAKVELAALRPVSSARSMSVGDNHFMHGELSRAREAYENARRRAKSERDLDEELRQLCNLSRVASKLGHYESALNYCREGLELVGSRRTVERVGLWAQAAETHCAAGFLDRAWGELQAGGADLETYPREPRTPERDAVAAALERSAGALFLARGEAEAAIEAYERCLALNAGQQRWTASSVRLHLAQARALAGDASGALRSLERAAKDKGAMGDRRGLARTYCLRVRIMRDLGMIEDASDILDAARDLVKVLDEPRLFALVHVEYGRHLLLGARVPEAGGAARRARDMASRAGAQAELARAEELLGLVALTEGRPEDARRHAGEAVTIADKLGMREVSIGGLLVMAEASPAGGRPELLARARSESEVLGNPFRELDVA